MAAVIVPSRDGSASRMQSVFDASLLLLHLGFGCGADIHDGHATGGARAVSFAATIVQILLLDIVFSLDSVITAVGMVDQLGVMVAAVVASVGVMLFAAKPIGDFVDAHPSVKVLALAFLVMVGMALTAEAFEVHIPKGYLYAAMAFSLGVEVLNIRARRKRQLLASA